MALSSIESFTRYGWHPNLFAGLQLNSAEEFRMSVYGYLRVSTKQQAEEGLSLEAQQVKLEGYAMMQGLVIDEFFIDRAVSGWKPFDTRPEGARLAGCMHSGDVILCSKLDRMFRSAKDALTVSDELKKKGVSLHLLDLGGDVTGNGVSRVFFTIVAAFAEFERDRIAERITDVKSNERSKGKFLGGSRPFGYQISKSNELIEDEGEQIIIDRVKLLDTQGKSLRAIASLVSNNDVKISHVTVNRILQ